MNVNAPIDALRRTPPSLPPSTACDEAHEPAATGLPRCGLLQGEDVEPEQLGQALPADPGVQLCPRPSDQRHPLQALCQLPRTGTQQLRRMIFKIDSVPGNF